MQRLTTRPSLANKARARIITVIPDQRRIEAGIRDGVVAVQVTETGPFFRWPEQGEMWSIFKEADTWRLGQLLEEGQPTTSVESLGPGEAKIYSEVIKTPAGHTLLRDVDVEGIVEDLTIQVTIGDGVETDFVIDHNFGTRAVFVEVYRNSTPWDTIFASVQRPTIDAVAVVFEEPPAIDAFNVLIRI